MHWHQLDIEQVADQLDSDLSRGLNDEQVIATRRKYGINELQQGGLRSPLEILAEQFKSVMILLLLVSSAISLVLGEYIDAIAILVIVGMNATLGLIQDYRAERALAALRQLSAPVARVKRSGVTLEIPAKELVPGDLVLIEAGNSIPADGRLVECANLKADESPLTGESLPVEKQTPPLVEGDQPLGDRRNMVYMGTSVTYGHGRFLVTATGMNSELGHIARSLESVRAEDTPLQRRLGQLGRSLAVIAVAIVALVFVLGIARGEQPRLMFMTAISLAVAVVPEGLPAVATVALTIGARRMFMQNALIRKLPAVETLGSVTVICSDKTGTLTQNRMTVTILDVAGERLDLTESTTAMDVPNASNSGKLNSEFAQPTPRLHRDISPTLALLLLSAEICNDAEVTVDTNGNITNSLGDPTETALIVASEWMGLRKKRIDSILPRIDEWPFDSERKCMSTLHSVLLPQRLEENVTATEFAALNGLRDVGKLQVTKGAVDNLLENCTYVWMDGQPVRIDEYARGRIEFASDELSGNGMRVLGVAFRPMDDGEPIAEKELIFLGMVGMIDPPRPEVRAAVARCREAGIRPIMITGDHPQTASRIASELDISRDGKVLSGVEVDRLTDAELRNAVNATSVFARVSPKHKLQLVQLLQDQGHVVAMTGDGVNDAPALKQAHIGVAMGISGTDVSKEASQMVLLDDNFATIVNATEQGRIVYDNIRKFILYVLTGNFGEVLVMLLGPLLGYSMPLLPLQILWINLVTDGLPGLALAIEPGERDTMRRPPQSSSQHVLHGLAGRILVFGTLTGTLALIAAILASSGTVSNTGAADESKSQTMIFTTLTLSQMALALSIRSTRHSLFTIGFASNPLMIVAILLTCILQCIVIYWPPAQHVFGTQSLALREIFGCMLLSLLVFCAAEGQKLLQSMREKTARQQPS